MVEPKGKTLERCDVERIAKSLPKCRPSSGGWVACCPAHNDKDPSLQITPSEEHGVLVKCFANCDGKQVLAALADSPGASTEAAAILRQMAGVRATSKRSHHAPQLRAVKKEPVKVYDIPLEPPEWRQGKRRSAVYRYRVGGKELGYTARYEGEGGSKIVIPFFGKKPDGSGCPLDTRPLYGLEHVKLGDTVLIVEGEKCADAVNRLQGAGLSAITWLGGSSAASKIDREQLAHLKGYRVVIWPDDDEPGEKASNTINKILDELGMRCEVVATHKTGTGYDVADYIEDIGADSVAAVCEYVDEHAEVLGEVQGFAHQLNDYGMAHVLAEYHGGNLICTDRGFFYRFTGKRWERVAKTEELKLCEPIISIMQAHAEEASGPQAKHLHAYAKAIGNDRSLKAIRSQLISRVTIGEQFPFDQHNHLINLQDGTLDLSSGKLSAHSAKEYHEKILAFNYRPEAPCPRFMKFISEALEQPTEAETKELLEYVQMAIGYTLTGETSSHCLFYLHGSGANGKSVLTEIISTMLGPYSQNLNVSAIFKADYSTKERALADLAGARLAVASETPEFGKLDEALVKTMTGGDRVVARQVYQASFSYKPTYKVWIGSNYLPIIKGQDDGIWRRLKLIPFWNSPKRQDPDLAAKIISEEIEGVFAWAVEGAVKWYMAGRRLPECSVIAATVSEMRDQMDVFGAFMRDRVVFDPEGRVKVNELYEAFRAYCDERFGRYKDAKHMGPRAFANRLNNMRIKSRHTMYGSERIGIKLRDDSWADPF